MSLSEVQRLQDLVYHQPNKENYETLVLEQMLMVERQLDVKTKAEERAMAARREAEQLRGEIEELRRETASAPATFSAVEREDYYVTWTAFLKEFCMRKEILSFLLSYPAEDFKLVELTTVSHWLDTWTTFFASAESSVRNLKRLERESANGNTLPPTRLLYDALDEVCRLQLQARTLVGRERYRRSSSSEEFVRDFMDSQQQLWEWCRKQRDTLAALKTLGDLIEFNNSFYANVPVMDSNFLVLMEQSEALMSNVRVQDALREVNREWVMLTLETYGKLQAACTREHGSSSLERQCAKWIQFMSPRLRRLLVSAQGTLAQDSDVPEAKLLVTTCEQLLKEHEAHDIVCTHLSDYTVREECVRPHLDALKAELQSSLTTTVLTFPLADTAGGQADYKSRVEELQEWIDVKSQKGTYVKLLERLELTKAMIEEHADVLFPEDSP
ncbi:conserved hypothetical protein [Leishmania infantum JPCM5]|uniref:Uncharacterized protein n=2 Tax=Leishmania infantum TaxID=5671 RepID=A4I2G9_LEIIN|nr:conserved hypothetical protein [Leishmania infantum JPCM5]CAC9497721.1 hypothetical_protein_-_conserved [Leishmania infantum]CAM68959.1 conserved hypothetical protein [Leishmania infantum JPCM5]SUZ42836.1 hypothetical_protein_-_conserved [Leishmania infantum]|eukprot:XP_001470580.1 conserved hypothetical protein [Leishmania infantum JPCM5]